MDQETLDHISMKYNSEVNEMQKQAPTAPLTIGRTLTPTKGHKAPTGRACGRCRGRAGQGLAANTSKIVAR